MDTVVSAMYVQCKEGFNLYAGELMLIYAEFRLYKTSENPLVVCYLTYSSGL